MLSLSRKVRERIVIGEGEDAVTVEVRRVKGNRVVLAMEGPQHVRIRRQELLTCPLPAPPGVPVEVPA